MKYVRIEGYPRIFAYDKADMMDDVGSPEEFLDAIQDEFSKGHRVELKETYIKECRYCDNMYEECDCLYDPTDPVDGRFCTEFEWREYRWILS